MRARPKYQVFISSTYGDLREEREAVTWVILSARHIPAGMENFTATDDRGWQTIKSVIDRSDYYVLILAGRYGSVDADGQSWTEKEYEYAFSHGIPVLVFVRSKKSITADLVEDDPSLRAKLEDFKRIVKERHMWREWATKDELVGHVSNALRNHIDDDEDRGSSRAGWYRGDELPTLATLDEFARLSGENARLQAELEAIKSSAETAPRLMLVDRDEQAFRPKVTRERTLKIYHPSLTSLDALIKESFGGDYLALNILAILELGVQNISSSLIEHVIVDLSLTPILGFHCGWYGKNLVEEGGRLTNSTIKLEYQNQYPDLVRLVAPDHVSIRLRIPRLPAGGTEYLPDLVVLGAVEGNRSWFNLKYKIVGSAGIPVAGCSQNETVFSGSTTMDKKTEDWEKRVLETERGIIILNKMLLKK
jgi:hypothetical protein